MRTDFDGRGAGTAILVRNDLQFREIRVPSVLSFRDVTGVQIFSNRISCSIFSVYVPNDVSAIRRECIDRLMRMDECVIL